MRLHRGSAIECVGASVPNFSRVNDDVEGGVDVHVQVKVNVIGAARAGNALTGVSPLEHTIASRTTLRSM
jgi:hypothetical protein